MPVQYFIRPDPQGQLLPAIDAFETGAVIDVLKRLAVVLAPHPTLYAIIVNRATNDVPADLIVVTERGFGVLTLQHEPGSVSLRGITWYAGSHAIPGNPAAGYRNPHEQVQRAADTIRAKLICHPELGHAEHFGYAQYKLCRSRSRRTDPWLPGNPTDWERFQFGTAVCFTSAAARLDRFPFWHYQKSKKNPHIKPWEHFAILTPAEIPGWVETLRFGVTNASTGNVALYQLLPDQITRIVRELFDAQEWIELDKLLPNRELSV